MAGEDYAKRVLRDNCLGHGNLGFGSKKLPYIITYYTLPVNDIGYDSAILATGGTLNTGTNITAGSPFPSMARRNVTRTFLHE